MRLHPSYLTPASILLGSLIVSAGLYFGLRARPVFSPTLNGAPMAVSPSPMPAEIRKKATQDAAVALQEKRVELVKTCWEPSAPQNPASTQAKYIFSLSFDADGREIARGISDVRGMERPATGRCLRNLPMGLRIPAPGIPVVSLEVELTLP